MFFTVFVLGPQIGAARLYSAEDECYTETGSWFRFTKQMSSEEVLMKRWSLKKKILSVYGLIAIVIIMIFGAYTSIISGRAYQKSVMKAYQNSADQIVANIRNNISNYSNYTFLIAQNTSLVNLLSTPLDIYDSVYLLNTSIEPTILFFTNNYDLIKSVQIYKEPRKQVASRFFLDNTSVKSEEWYVSTVNQYGAYWYFKEDHIFIAKRIQSFNDSVTLGVVVFDVEYRQLFDGSIHDWDLKLMVLNHDIPVYGDTGGENFTELFHYDLAGTDLSLRFFTAQSNIRPQFMQTYGLPFTVIIICILLSALLMWGFFRYISRRIDSITSAVTAIETQNFIISLPPGEPDELGTLSDCLNAMSDKIQNLIQEIRIVKDQERQAEIDALQAKITPHFLYNIMDTINWYAIEGDGEAICDITNNLALYYRTNLNGGQALTTARKELQNIRAYISLQQMLTDHGFEVAYELAEDLMEYTVCNFILQPVVENAIKHGINPLKNRRGHLIVRFYQRDDFLCFDIEDNGAGIQKDQLRRLFIKKGNGYGLTNVMERIRMLFGQEYGVSVNSTPNAGTRVTITLPLVKNQPSPAGP